MINILHVIAALPVGGVENTITRIIREYSKEKYNPIICCIREGGILAEKLAADGYEIIILNRMKSHRFDFSVISEIYRIIKKRHVSIVRTHQYHANLYGRAAAILANVPCIVASVHNIYTRDTKTHRRIFNHFLSKFTDKVVAVSSAVKEDIMKYDKIKEEKVVVIHNGIPLNEFNCFLPKKRAREMLSLPPTVPLIGTVGRLVEQKGHRYLIEAASLIKDCIIVIAGDGPLRKELELLATQINSNVIFLGSIEPKIVPVFLNAIDIFCFPSIWEGFGIAVVEAMACGLPIIASDIPPHREVIADAGIFVPPQSTEQMVRSLNLIIQNPVLRDALSQKSKQRAKIFSIEQTAASYETLYHDILMRKKWSG